MFVLDLTYTVPVGEIDALLAEHVAWMRKQFDEGRFLAAGRKQPRTGGVIIAVSDDRAEVEAVVAEDPFAQHRAATYRITEFLVTATVPALDQYRQQPPTR